MYICSKILVMNYLKILLFVLFINFSNAQSPPENYSMVSEKFEELYNSENYNQIFELFSPDMKAILPEEQTVDFMEGLNAQAGKILNRKFVRFINGSFALYRTKFERAVLAVNISVNSDNEINGFSIEQYKDERTRTRARTETAMMLPFNDEWTVFWGGDTKDLNYHVENQAQKNAFDLVITDEHGKTYKSHGKTNDDYYAFGKELIAPCDAEVVLVVDGIKDNKPGELNPMYTPGNTLILKTSQDEFLVFAHFKQNSIVVENGQQVKMGEKLGLCGNSGNSSEAHLHFHVQNKENMNTATGIKSYFSQIMVNGELRSEHSPVKGEKIKNQ